MVISPWCEHITEAYDPVLVRATVKAACAAIGKPVPAAPTAWRWRLLGLLLGVIWRFGIDGFAFLKFIPASADFAGLLFPGFCCSPSS